jgi:hypothetical protein
MDYFDLDTRHISDSKDFRTYAKQIETLLANAPERGITIREIHDAVGRNHIDWTMLALDYIEAEELGARPCRYRLRYKRADERMPLDMWLMQMERVKRLLRKK